MRVSQDHHVSPLPKVRFDQGNHVRLLTDDEAVLVRLGCRQRQEDPAPSGAENGHAPSLPGLRRFQGLADHLKVPLEFQPRLVIVGQTLPDLAGRSLEWLEPVGFEPLGDTGVDIAADRHPLALRLIQQDLNVFRHECGHILLISSCDIFNS